MILAAQHIRSRCLEMGLIDPFHERTVCEGFTFGLSSCGYDIRIAEDVKIGRYGFSLASSIERFNLPTSLRMTVHDKSSWARRGLAVQTTIAEPGWRGFLTLELSNHGFETILIHAGTPIAQVAFDLLYAPTEQPYEGRYQDQKAGAQPAIVAVDGHR